MRVLVKNNWILIAAVVVVIVITAFFNRDRIGNTVAGWFNKPAKTVTVSVPSTPAPTVSVPEDILHRSQDLGRAFGEIAAEVAIKEARTAAEETLKKSRDYTDETAAKLREELATKADLNKVAADLKEVADRPAFNLDIVRSEARKAASEVRPVPLPASPSAEAPVKEDLEAMANRIVDRCKSLGHEKALYDGQYLVSDDKIQNGIFTLDAKGLSEVERWCEAGATGNPPVAVTLVPIEGDHDPAQTSDTAPAGETQTAAMISEVTGECTQEQLTFLLPLDTMNPDQLREAYQWCFDANQPAAPIVSKDPGAPVAVASIEEDPRAWAVGQGWEQLGVTVQPR